MNFCAIDRITTLFCGMALALSLLTATKSIYSLKVAVSTRKLLLIMGVLVNLTGTCTCAYSIISNYYSVKMSIFGLFLSHFSNVLLLQASCKRYFVFFAERKRRIAEISVLTIVCILLMLSFVKLSQFMITPIELSNSSAGLWIYLLVVIPLIHIVFGIVYFYRILNKNIASKSNELHQVYSIQVVCTLFMVSLWITWTVLETAKLGNDGLNLFLMAVAFELENSVGIISISIPQLLKSDRLERKGTNKSIAR
jgi:hypothetical protein